MNHFKTTVTLMMAFLTLPVFGSSEVAQGPLVVITDSQGVERKGIDSELHGEMEIDLERFDLENVFEEGKVVLLYGHRTWVSANGVERMVFVVVELEEL